MSVFLQSSEIVLNNLERATQQIQSFKQISVDQSSDEVRDFNLNDYLHNIITSLKPRLKSLRHKIDIHCSPTLHIKSNPGVFYQIFSNLIMNSIIHGFDGIESGNILIEAQELNGELIITYEDNGKGMDSENLAKVFDPFFTTKRDNGGSGLGTHIIYNLVTQKLHGTIKANCDNGGLKIIMIFKV